MSASISLDTPLPTLRSDLEFFPGPSEADGSPTCTIHDPITGVFRKLGWAESTVLKLMRLTTTFRELHEMVNRTTTLSLSSDELVSFCAQAHAEGFTRASGTGEAEKLYAVYKAQRPGLGQWLLAHYLYFRIPLFHPDSFLEKTLPLVRWLASTPARIAYITAFLFGMMGILLHLDAYIQTFPHFFNAEGVLFYILTILFVKTIHEFSHAYTAKAFGVRVPTMGIAFMVFAPVAFCDVTDGWKLQRRRKRFAISAAGICAEIAMAGLSLFLWTITPPGLWRSIFFLVSSVTVASTLIINLNPAMRFDGYYLLSDMWGIDNLRERAFGMTRWLLRKTLLGITMEPPEPNIGRRRTIGMAVYSIYAWLYRLALYVGIAILVYYKFTKLVGVVLFAAEIHMFILRPLHGEIRTLYSLRERIRITPRFLGTTGAVALLLFWALLPLPRKTALPAVVVARDSQPLYAPISGQLLQLHVTRNDRIQNGMPLFAIQSRTLNAEIAIFNEQEELLRTKFTRQANSLTPTGSIRSTHAELAYVRARLEKLQQQKEANIVHARLSGQLVEWDTSLHNGQFVQRGSILGRIDTKDTSTITAFVQEKYLESLTTGQTVSFFPSGSIHTIRGTIRAIRPFRTEWLEHKGLASIFSGDLPAIPTTAGGMKLVGSYYEVDVQPIASSTMLFPGRLGRIWIRTRPRSLVIDALRYAWRVLIRESGF